MDELGYGGYLFVLGRAPGEDYTEDDPPIMAGASIFLAKERGYTYFINFPSGVEYSEAVNSKSAVEYKEWRNQIASILESFNVLEIQINYPYEASGGGSRVLQAMVDSILSIE